MAPFCQFLSDAALPCHSDQIFVGASFDERIHDALSRVLRDQVEVVYKGFDPSYDSFLAFPHVVSSAGF